MHAAAAAVPTAARTVDAVATASLTSEEVLQQAFASSLSAISAVATSFGVRRPSRPDDHPAVDLTSAGASAPTNTASSVTVGAVAAPESSTVAVAAPTIEATPPPRRGHTHSTLRIGGAVRRRHPRRRAETPTAVGSDPTSPTTAASTSDPTAGALPTVPTSTGEHPTGLGAVALSPQCPPWLLPLSSYCADLLAK